MNSYTVLVVLWVAAIPFVGWVGLSHWGSSGAWLVTLAILGVCVWRETAFCVNVRDGE